MLANIWKIWALMMLVGSNALADAAFGIEYGGELPNNARETETAGYYRVPSPPKPHSLFEGYAVHYTPETGVCMIYAFSKTFENDKYGTKAKEKYNSLGVSLKKKYGPNGDKWEELKASALWKDPDEFAQSLVTGDRNHSRWFKPAAGSNSEFDYIEINIEALDSSKTYITLRYQNYELFDKCRAILDQADDSSL